MRSLVAVLLFFVFLNSCVFVILSQYGRHLEYSIFYDAKVERVLQQEQQRQEKAIELLDTVADMNFVYRNSVGRKYCVGVLTTRRPSHYAIQSVSSLLRHMNWTEMNKVNLVVLNGHSLNTDAFELSKFVTVRNATTMWMQANATNYREFNRKLSLEYAEIIDWCLEYQPQYVLILEDDAYSSNHFVTKVDQTLQQLKGRDDWCLVKLFRSDRWDGWSRETTHQLVLLTLFGGFVFAVIYRVTCGSPLSEPTHHIIFMYVIVMILGSLTTLWILFAVGRQHVIPRVQGISEVAGCCCQADLYPASVAASLANFFRNAILNTPLMWTDSSDRELVENDLLIDRFARTVEHKHMLKVVPSLFQHIGAASSNPAKPNVRVLFMHDSGFQEADE